MSTNQFPEFPPGPRWFVGIRVEQGRVGILVREGASDSDINDLDLPFCHAVYVFVDKITETDLMPVVQAMFQQTGPRLSEAFEGRIANMYSPTPMGPQGES